MTIKKFVLGATYFLSMFILSGCAGATKSTVSAERGEKTQPNVSGKAEETISVNASFFETEPNAALTLLRKSYDTISENGAPSPEDIETLSEAEQETIGASLKIGERTLPATGPGPLPTNEEMVLSTAPSKDVEAAAATISRAGVNHPPPPKIDVAAVPKQKVEQIHPEAVIENGPKGDTVRVRLVSWRDLPFQTVKRQAFDYSCGSAAVATLMSYIYGVPTSERQVFREMFARGNKEKIRHEGFSMLDMANYLNAHGMEAKGYRLSQKAIVKHRLPFIALVNNNGYNHFVVVKTIDDERVLVGDPNLGNLVYSRDDFSKLWNGMSLVVLNNMQMAQKAFGNENEWRYARAKAPIRTGSDVGSDPANLGPMNWQITPVVGNVLPAAMIGSVN